MRVCPPCLPCCPNSLPATEVRSARTGLRLQPLFFGRIAALRGACGPSWREAAPAVPPGLRPGFFRSTRRRLLAHCAGRPTARRKVRAAGRSVRHAVMGANRPSATRDRELAPGHVERVVWASGLISLNVTHARTGAGSVDADSRGASVSRRCAGRVRTGGTSRPRKRCQSPANCPRLTGRGAGVGWTLQKKPAWQARDPAGESCYALGAAEWRRMRGQTGRTQRCRRG